jgi:DNA-binding XRE family transcriptional regulator
MVATMKTETGRVRSTMPAPTTHAPVPSLRYWRIKRLMTQRALAQKAGVATSTVAHGEEAYALSLLTAAKLAEALGVTVRQLRATPPDEEE